MGYVMCYAPCINCNKVFGFNPHLVPSIAYRGSMEPVCRDCIEMANAVRKQTGASLFEILPGAYEPLDECEL